MPLVIFVFKAAAERMVGKLPKHSYGVVPNAELADAAVFLMPAPTALRAHEAKGIAELEAAFAET